MFLYVSTCPCMSESFYLSHMYCKAQVRLANVEEDIFIDANKPVLIKDV